LRPVFSACKSNTENHKGEPFFHEHYVSRCILSSTFVVSIRKHEIIEFMMYWAKSPMRPRKSMLVESLDNEAGIFCSGTCKTT